MKRIILSALAILSLTLTAACTRIETGEVGLRLNSSKQIEGTELMEGSWNQTIVGDVLTFPVRDIALQASNLRPVTIENTPVGDLDFTVIYNINPTAVSELWSKKSRSFHTFHEGDWYLMHAYMNTTANNAAQKVISSHEMLKLQKDREVIEVELLSTINGQLKKDGFDHYVTVSSAPRVQALQPNQAILEAATKTIEAEQKLNTAKANTELAKQEAERQKVLSENSEKTIAYMDAESRRKIAEAIANGKATTIVLPMDFKGLVNTK